MPDRVEDLIRKEADRLGVPPAVALAVAEQESGFNPTAVNPQAVGDEHAIGTFQLLPSTAKTLGVDPNDPRQNITGGVTYLRQLFDKHQGNLDKILAEYGGVKTDTSYVPGVLARVQKFKTAPAPAPAQTQPSTAAVQPAVQPSPTHTPVAGRGTAGTNVGTTAAQNAWDFSRAYNPMTPEGRENLLATAGSLGATALAASPEVGAPLSLAARAYRILGPVAGAALGGSAASAVEQGVTTGSIDPGTVAEAGARQGAYDIGGQVLFGALSKAGRIALGPGIARRAADAIQAERKAIATTGRDAVEAVRIRMRAAVDAAKSARDSAVAALKGTAQAGTEAASRRTASRLADIELDHATKTAELARQYDNLLNQPPSITGAASAVKETIEGPAKRALDLAGERVGAAAETGPALPITAVKDAIADMAEQHRPVEIFGASEAPSAIGYGLPRVVPIAARPAAMATGERITVAEYEQALRDAARRKNAAELPGILGRIQSVIGDEVPFRVAHQIKRLLDESVNWDRTARKHMEVITKGARVKLREVMAKAGHAPYEEATAAYAALRPLYYKGIGKRLLDMARLPQGSSQVAGLLKDADPIGAQTVKQLLVDWSAAGGNAELGQQAWNRVVDQYTYEHLISGGIDKLGQRMNQLLAERPEFVRVVFGDPAVAPRLTNLAKIADGLAEANRMLAGQTAGAKAIGEGEVAAAEDVGKRAVSAVRRQGQSAVRQTAGQAATQVRAARSVVQEARQAVKEKATRLSSSSLGERGEKRISNAAADVLIAGSRGLPSVYGIRSMMRLLRSPTGNDLVQWASASPLRTQRLVRILTSPVPAPAVAAFLREAIGAIPEGER